MDENSKIKLEKITVAGNDRTALSFFDSELEEIKAKGLTLGEMAKLMSAKTERLLSLDMFEAVDTNLVVSTDIHGAPVGELKLNVKEKGVTYFKAETFVKSETTSEVGFELQAALRNPIGYGETFRVNSTTTQTGAREYLSTLSVPNVGPKKLKLNLSLKSSTENMSYYTAYHLKTDALNVELSTQDRKHHLVGEYALRDEIPMGNSAKLNSPDATTSTWSLFDYTAPLASAVTTNTAMASVKTSLKYLCTLWDSRDNASNPSKGSYLQGTVEVAAPPGTAQFLRTELTGQHHVALGPPLMGQHGLTASLCGSLGMIRPILSSARGVGSASTERHGVTHLCDRYQLGGSNSLRGFEQCGTGPRAYRPMQCSDEDESLYLACPPQSAGAPVKPNGSVVPASEVNGVHLSDSLGGDLRANLFATLSVPVPVPVLASSQMRAFAFFNAGAIGSLNNMQRGGVVANGLNSVRASVGGGFSVAAGGQIRLETTYSIPLLKAPQDQTKGFQIGIALTLN